MNAASERLGNALSDRYRIERELGAGGMATVYLAHDLKHERRVALKVLKPELAAVLGADRFVQEIRTTASLQHPHILALFDSGTADGFLFYVMPYIEGETLRDKLNRETQLGVDEAVRIAREVADALDYAHRHGIIHRDIKPENILLHDGRAMVADFGIALAVSAAAGGRMTETGTSIGTPHYMSPEQATADKELTARSDIYSLASVLYEMLAGDPPHTGSSAQQVIMKIIADVPRPVTELRRSVPANVAAALAQALEKLPADRFESAKTFADALANPAFATTSARRAETAAASRTWRSWIRDPRSRAALLAVAALGALALAGRILPRGDPPAAVTLRFTLEGPADSTILSIGSENLELYKPVVSADDRMVAFEAHKATGNAIYVRRLDSFESFEIPGDGRGVFLSPDNASIGFMRGSEVWTADLTERVPIRLGELPEASWDIWYAVWHRDGRVLVAGARGLWALQAGRGEPTLLVATDSAGRERFGHVDVLPDGRILLEVVVGTGRHAEVVPSNGGPRSRVFAGLEQVRIVDDLVLYVQAGQLRAALFDARRLEPIGPSVALPDPLTRPGRSIAWVEGSGGRSFEPVWVSVQGTVTPVGLDAGYYRWPRVSPDGMRIAIAIATDVGGLSTAVLRSGATFPIAGWSEPVFSSDGRHVFTSRENRPLGGLLRNIADGSRAPDTLLALDRGDTWPTDASRDGRWLVYYGATLGTGEGSDATDPNDLMFMDLSTRETRRLQLPGAQRAARFSPDGHWIAYQSTEKGSADVFVRPWPELDAGYQISSGGGTEPLWATDGGSIYYRQRDQVIEVPITVRDGAIERAAPRTLFTGNFNVDRSGDYSWDIAPDGRFLMLRPVPGGRIDLRVALNWIGEVRARLERAR